MDFFTGLKVSTKSHLKNCLKFMCMTLLKCCCFIATALAFISLIRMATLKFGLENNNNNNNKTESM